MYLRSARLSRLAVPILVVALISVSIFAFYSRRAAYGSLRLLDTYYDWAYNAASVPPSSNAPPLANPLAGGVPQKLLTRRANATFVMLARNSDIDGVLRSVRGAEDRFNRDHGYPWVFLNEEPFSDEFKRRVGNLISSPIEWGLIPRDHWFQPEWIDEDRAAEARVRMKDVIYGGSLPYRNMCRFNSGYFYRHPLMQKYRYYWRVEPDVHFHCDIRFDPFLFMSDHNKTYGFTISLYEFTETIETLWKTTREFMELHPEHLARDNALGFLSDDGGETYNNCHFWSNFEIADMELWRSPAYSAYFDYLDRKGGFYYERWGDAPVHSIGAALFSNKDQIHIFREIGYEHVPFMRCPTEQNVWERGLCMCDPERSFDYYWYSCLERWDKVIGYERPNASTIS